MDSKEIVSLPTQKQLEWLRDNKTAIVREALDDVHAGYLPVPGDRKSLYAIMHKVTEAADAEGLTIDRNAEGDYVEPWELAKLPTRFQAELAALGAPEDVVNDG